MHGVCRVQLSRRQIHQMTAISCGALLLGRFGSTARAADCVGAAPNLPKEILGIRIPDSNLASSAATLAREASPRFLFNHCMRTFVFGSIAAQRQGWKYDDELVFIAAVMHDLALLEQFESDEKSFEEAGADVARSFLRERHVSGENADLVGKAIELHTSGAALKEKHEIAIIHLGAATDVLGLDLDRIAKKLLDETVDTFPRADFKRAFKQLVGAHGRRHPKYLRDWAKPFAKEAEAADALRTYDQSPWTE